jgi:hypothetical protein
MAIDDDNTGRNLALVAGGGALAWLLLRGRGLGFGSAGPGSTDSTSAISIQPVQVRLDDLGVTVDGTPQAIAGAAALTQERGAADVMITGAARAGTAVDLVAALKATRAKVVIKGGR